MNGIEVRGGLSLAGLLAFTPFGLSLETIFIATAFTMLGAFARVGFEISAAVDKPGGIKWARIVALLASSLISAATISVLVLVAMKLLTIPSETILVFLLICFGYFGPTGIPWLLNMITTTVTKLTGIKLPVFLVPPSSNGEAK